MLRFHLAASIHGINDVWIYPSQECDEDIGATLVSYGSPAVYNFTPADAGKVMFFVNSVGIRCQSGVSLYARVSDTVLSSQSNDTTAASSISDTTTTSENDVLVEVQEPLVNDTVGEAVLDIGGENIAIGIHSPNFKEPKHDDVPSSGTTQRVLSLEGVMAVLMLWT